MKKYIYILILSLFIFTTCSKESSDPIVTKYSLETQVTPSQGGTISPASGNYNSGDKVMLTASPAANFEFKN